MTTKPEAASDSVDPAAAFLDVPGVLLPHMRLPPAREADLPLAGPCRWDGPPLLCPPDGLCFIYAWLAFPTRYGGFFDCERAELPRLHLHSIL